MIEQEALAGFAALANKSRLAVLRCLVQAGPHGMTAGEIARSLGASPSQTSFHLSVLSDSALVESERQSRQVIYRIRFERVGELVAFLLDDCCGGSPVARACCGLAEGC